MSASVKYTNCANPVTSPAECSGRVPPRERLGSRRFQARPRGDPGASRSSAAASRASGPQVWRRHLRGAVRDHGLRTAGAHPAAVGSSGLLPGWILRLRRAAGRDGHRPGAGASGHRSSPRGGRRVGRRHRPWDWVHPGCTRSETATWVEAVKWWEAGERVPMAIEEVESGRLLGGAVPSTRWCSAPHAGASPVPATTGRPTARLPAAAPGQRRRSGRQPAVPGVSGEIRRADGGRPRRSLRRWEARHSRVDERTE